MTDAGKPVGGPVTGMDYDDRADELESETVLTHAEAEVQALKERGLSHAEIADEIDRSKSTVDELSRRINERVEAARATVEKLDADQSP